MRGLLRSPLHGPLSGRLLLLHVTGRTSGKVYDIPVGYHDLDGQMTVLTSSAWRANVWGGADVEVTLRGRRRRARAVLVEDPDTVAGVYRARIKDLGHEKAGRQLGIRINVDRVPTLEELAAAVKRSGLSLIHLDLM